MAGLPAIERESGSDPRCSVRAQDLRYRNTGYDVGRPGCKAADTGVAICPEQIEVVSVDVTSYVCNFGLPWLPVTTLFVRVRTEP